MAKHRLNLVLSDQAKARIDRLVDATEADTPGDVVKNAVRLYEFVISKLKSNEEFLTRNKVTGDITLCSLIESVEITEAVVAKEAIGHRKKPAAMALAHN